MAIKAARERLELTQAELAARSGISLRAVKALESGETRRPQAHTNKALWKVLREDEFEARRKDLALGVKALLVAIEAAEVDRRQGARLTHQVGIVRRQLGALLEVKGVTAMNRDPLAASALRIVNILAERYLDLKGSLEQTQEEVNILRDLTQDSVGVATF